jgi:hypothetical protein
MWSNEATLMPNGHKPEDDVYHLISSHPGLPESSLWHALKQS